jgi:hypothetical protein
MRSMLMSAARTYDSYDDVLGLVIPDVRAGYPAAGGMSRVAMG